MINGELVVDNFAGGGAATSRGSSATGNYGLSVARGNGVKVKGGLGAMRPLPLEKSISE